jgi:hypothetical protein
LNLNEDAAPENRERLLFRFPFSRLFFDLMVLTSARKENLAPSWLLATGSEELSKVVCRSYQEPFSPYFDTTSKTKLAKSLDMFYLPYHGFSDALASTVEASPFLCQELAFHSFFDCERFWDPAPWCQLSAFLASDCNVSIDASLLQVLDIVLRYGIASVSAEHVRLPLGNRDTIAGKRGSSVGLSVTSVATIIWCALSTAI